MATEFHESFTREEDDVRASERKLGLTFAAVCAIVGLVKLYRNPGLPISWFVAAAVFAALALFWTTPLRPLGLLWHRLGLVLFKVVNPAVMAILFYGALAPVGLLMRLLGKDPLHLTLDRRCSSYWLDRRPPGPDGRQMKDQF